MLSNTKVFAFSFLEMFLISKINCTMYSFFGLRSKLSSNSSELDPIIYKLAYLIKKIILLQNYQGF